MVSLEELYAREETRFVETHPRSRELAERAQGDLHTEVFREAVTELAART